MNTLQRQPVQTEPYNAEAPMEALATPLTPDGLFYVRSHFAVPEIDPDAWRLVVDLYPGKPARSLLLSDLQTLPPRTVTVTLECAGNGRTTLDPPAAGTPWAFGAVSTAAFTGTSLHNLLDAGGLSDEIVELVFLGSDTGAIPTGETIRYGRSLSPDMALHPDTIVAWTMNGRPLPVEHGSPLRLVVPRWYGVASVKWLGEVRAVSVPYDGYYQTNQYLYNGQAGLPDGTPVTTMRVRSVIASPVDGQTVRPEPQMIAGTAWSGDAAVAQVEVSTDGGASWQTAELEAPISEYAAVAWRLAWTPDRSGNYELLSRVTDASGKSQPLEQVWTEQGYGNNIVQRIGVRVLDL